MEHYGAEPRPPIHKCLDDVERSDIYIGSIARRYGWIPPGYARSIAEEEYWQAMRSWRPILIFALEDSAAPWSEVEETDEQQAALKRFREHLLKEHMAALFGSCDALERKVFASLANLNAVPSTLYDQAREDKMFDLLGGTDTTTISRARRQLVDMGSAAYAAELRQRLRRGLAKPEERTEDGRELAEIENRNNQGMPILITERCEHSKDPNGHYAGRRVDILPHGRRVSASYNADPKNHTRAGSSCFRAHSTC